MIRVHGTCVEVAGTGVLLRGPAGSGKSDLALRLIDEGGRLVADDQVELAVVRDQVHALAPASILGRLEVRGLGIVELSPCADATLGLVVDLAPAADVERMPEPESVILLGLALPLLKLAPFEHSATAKLRLAVARLARTNAGARV
ncbi:MAG TPA: HPr kinase/phosphatase C-terminal domain-containing protein [Alphaproteobacteria bacterium]|nr:HPr kinase/phosphatase C-terminal domain-containing protein [Alphaproteobacteria bacterium]